MKTAIKAQHNNLGKMKEALSQESLCLVEFLRLLIHAEQSKWFLEAGYSSLFVLCTSELGLSRSSALKRIVVARLACRFQEVLGLLESRKLHLSAVLLLAPYLTEDNRKELLEAAQGKSEREIEKWLSARFPKEPKDVREKLEWLDGEKAELTLIVDSELLALIERAKQLMKHHHPKGETAALLKDILKKHLKTIDPLQKVTRPTSPKTSPVQTRYIPRRIQAAVWKRDENRCAYISPEGKRCDERAGLEIDHCRPWAHGGSSTDISNLRLLCFAHNRWLALKTFGKCYSRPLPGA
jgi:5-methylcytosine-specific restriction endonuclease McrA